MKTNVFRNPGFGLFLAACLVLALLGCGSPNSPGGSTVTVTGVTVDPATVSVPKGGSYTFTATVEGTGNPSQTVTWVVFGYGVESTGITSTGRLIVGGNEDADELTVVATSTANPRISGEAIVKVIVPVKLTGVVSISGTPQAGYTLTANTDNLLGNGAIGYQWKRASTAQAAGGTISGATARTYDLVAADVDQYITVTVTRTENVDSVTSNAVGPIQPAPTNIGSVDGTVTVTDGVTDVSVDIPNSGNLTLLRSGNLTVTISGSYQAYRWYVDGVPLSDETVASLVLNGADYTAGTHVILVMVYKSDVPYSREILFTVN